jgi:hypothetical protein
MPQTFNRNAGSVESPDSGSGGTTPFDSTNVTSGSTSISVSNSDQTDTARWFNFGKAPTEVAKILVQFDWAVGGSLDVDVTDAGTADASYTFSIVITGAASIDRNGSIGVSGPGPISDHLDIVEGATESISIPRTTLISSFQIVVILSASASSSGSGAADASPNCSINNIKLVITLADGTVQIMM